MLKKKFKIQKAKETLVILSRIDTEFSDDELINLIQNLYDNGVDHIYFIVAQLLTLKTFLLNSKFGFWLFRKKN